MANSRLRITLSATQRKLQQTSWQIRQMFFRSNGTKATCINFLCVLSFFTTLCALLFFFLYCFFFCSSLLLPKFSSLGEEGSTRSHIRVTPKSQLILKGAGEIFLFLLQFSVQTTSQTELACPCLEIKRGSGLTYDK